MSTWNDLVARGRNARERLGQAKWELGDLADEVETSYNGGQLQVYADEIELEYNTLRGYRYVSRAWPSDLRRSKAPWSVYEMLAGREDRYEILAERDHWTVDAMRERLNKRQTRYPLDDPDEAQYRLRNLEPAERAELVRETLNDPEVAESVGDAVTDYVAADPKLTTEVTRKRQKAAGIPEAQPRDTTRDYDDMVTRGVDLLSVAIVAESSGKWTPTERSEALLYFLTQALGKRNEPTGEHADLVNDKLENLLNEVEEYANQGTA